MHQVHIPSSRALGGLITGHRAWTGTEDNWLGGPRPVWWSHADAAAYRSWLGQPDLDISA